MARVPYARVVGMFMYNIMCIRPNISQVVSMVSRYMHNPSKNHRLRSNGFFDIYMGQLMLDYYLRRIIVNDVLGIVILISLEILTSENQQRVTYSH